MRIFIFRTFSVEIPDGRQQQILSQRCHRKLPSRNETEQTRKIRQDFGNIHRVRWNRYVTTGA